MFVHTVLAVVCNLATSCKNIRQKVQENLIIVCPPDKLLLIRYIGTKTCSLNYFCSIIDLHNSIALLILAGELFNIITLLTYTVVRIN